MKSECDSTVKSEQEPKATQSKWRVESERESNANPKIESKRESRASEGEEALRVKHKRGSSASVIRESNATEHGVQARANEIRE